MKEENPFIPNVDDLRFTLTISVYANCQQMKIAYEPNKEVFFQEILGAIEFQRTLWIMNQNIDNLQIWINKRNELEALTKSDDSNHPQTKEQKAEEK